MSLKLFLTPKRFVVTVTILSVLLAPTVSLAAVGYQPRTNEEMIAYLYGRIAQLVEIKALLDGGASASDINKLEVNYVTARTHKATEIEETTAVLRGEVNLFGDTTASAWFEYGEDKSFLDLRSSKKSVRSVYDRAVRVKVSSLEDDETYYFRIVALNKDGTTSYGDIYQFRTD